MQAVTQVRQGLEGLTYHDFWIKTAVFKEQVGRVKILVYASVDRHKWNSREPWNNIWFIKRVSIVVPRITKEKDTKYYWQFRDWLYEQKIVESFSIRTRFHEKRREGFYSVSLRIRRLDKFQNFYNELKEVVRRWE